MEESDKINHIMKLKSNMKQHNERNSVGENYGIRRFFRQQIFRRQIFRHNFSDGKFSDTFFPTANFPTTTFSDGQIFRRTNFLTDTFSVG